MLLDQQYYIVSFFQSHIPAFPVGDTPRSDHSVPVFSTAMEAAPTHAALGRPPASQLTTQRWSNSSEWCLPPHPGWTQGQSFGAGHSLSPLGKKWNVLRVWASVFISCSMGLRGDLRLFTQVLVEFWLQETGVRVVLHQAVDPFLGGRKAATCSLLYILGN